MTEIPTVYLIFAIAAFFFDADPSVKNFTTINYSPDDPITWTRSTDPEKGDTWAGTSSKGLEYGNFSTESGRLTITMEGKVIDTCDVSTILTCVSSPAPVLRYNGMEIKMKKRRDGSVRFDLKKGNQRPFPILVKVEKG